jgi:hypothetical protein
MRQEIIVNSFCLLIALGCVGAAVWALVTGQIGEQGIDGLFLLIVCLTIALIFSFIPLQAARQGLLRDLLKRKRLKPGTENVGQAAPVTSQDPQEKV